MIKPYYVKVDAISGFTGNIKHKSKNIQNLIFVFVFRGCTGLTEAAFQLLTAEVYAEWACDKCLASKNIPLVKFKP